MEHISVSYPHDTPLGSTPDQRRSVDTPTDAQFTVRRDATSRSDGRVTDVLAPVDRATRRTAVFLANPTAGAIEPAALAEFARRTVRHAVPIYDDQRDVLSRVDDLLAVNHPGVFMTALFGSVQQHDHSVSVCITNRGHALPLVVSAGTARPIGVHSTVLGSTAHRDLRGDLSRVTLGRGEQLLLINDRPTDGPMPQPYRPDVVRNLPVNVSDHDLAEHIIDIYGAASVDVIVISARSGCDR